MLRKSEVKEAIRLFNNANEEVIRRNVINIYTLAANIEKIERRIYKKVS